MPCICHYNPSKTEQKIFKQYCYNLVDFIKLMKKEGDPVGCTLKDAHTLIDHLYNPSLCNEKKPNLE